MYILLYCLHGNHGNVLCMLGMCISYCIASMVIMIMYCICWECVPPTVLRCIASMVIMVMYMYCVCWECVPPIVLPLW